MTNLSSRYTHAEREGIACGRVNRGDIASWSHGTSKPFGSQFKPIRPEVQGCAPISTPCKRLHEYGLAAIEAPHKPEAVCLPCDAKPHPGLDMGRAQIVADVNERLSKHFVKSKKATGKPIVMPKPSLKSVLDDCPATDPQILAILKEKSTVERADDVELHNDTPLPYDRPCKANNWRR